ncbi:MAG TPA: RNA polymerase factor sigma-32 [Oligoflexia bacterium]|nr:RNA polymerase factor sigma-32 [Oligoflexia bacterium]HMP48831.1 RNA polymerase factor sigma-32 [Oligoflexia bacterium]
MVNFFKKRQESKSATTPELARVPDEIIPVSGETSDKANLIEEDLTADEIALDDHDIQIDPDELLHNSSDDLDFELISKPSNETEFDSNAQNNWTDDDLSPLSSFNANEDYELIPQGSSEKALVKYDPLQSYLQEIKHIPALSRDEEHSLAVKYKTEGDKAAGLKLVMANLRLVVMIAREHQRNVQNILDLVQEGNIGLLEAVEKYDPYRGIRFPSYAVFWIRAYVLRYLINNIRLVKIGTTQAQRKLFFNLMKEREKLEQEGFKPEATLLAERLGVKESEVLEMEQRLRLPDLSVDAPVNRNEGGDPFDLHSIIPDQKPDVENQVMIAELNSSVREVIDEFREFADEKEIAIIDQRLLCEEPRTLQEIADEFGISRERIRQIEQRLKTKLKDFFTSRLGSDIIPDNTYE